MRATEIPDWVLFLQAISPVLAALIAIGGVLATSWFNDRRDERRVDAEHLNRLRDERISAYRKVLTTTSRRHAEEQSLEEIAEAVSEAELLAETKELGDEIRLTYMAHLELATAVHHLQEKKAGAKEGLIKASEEIADRRIHFIGLARRELGLKPGIYLKDPEEPEDKEGT